MQRLRVLSIAHTAVTTALGRRRYAPLADRPGLETHILAPSRWREFGRSIEAEPATGFPLPVHIAPILLPHVPGAGWYLHVYPGLQRFVRRLEPDVIHLWEEPWSLVAMQAIAARGKARIVLEVDQNILKRLPPPFQAIRRWVLARTDVALVRSPDAEAVIRACGFKGEAVEIGYGVDQDIFHPTGETRTPTSDPLRLCYVGRLLEEKGLDDVLVAMRLQAASSCLTIQGDGPHRNVLLRRTAELGLAHRVTFKGWAAPREVAATYRQADVSVLLTRTTARIREQFGRAIIESQSCAVPVIGSSSGSIPSVIGDGGWVVPEGSPSDLASLLDRLDRDRGLVAERATAGRRNVEQRFSFERVADALERAWRCASEAERRSRQRAPGSFVTNSM